MFHRFPSDKCVLIIPLGLVLLFAGSCEIEDSGPGSWSTCPKDLALVSTSVELKLGRTTRIGVQSPDDDCPVYWSVESGSAVQLVADYRYADVTGIEPGRSILTARRPNGSNASCTVDVVPNEFVSLELSPDTLTIVGFVQKVVGTLDLRLSADDGLPVEPLADVNWAISDPEIASLIGLSTGATLIGLAAGTATVTAVYSGPGAAVTLSDSSVVNVVPAADIR